MIRRLILVPLIVACAATAVAQPQASYPEKRGFKLTGFPRLVKIAENV